MRFPSKLAVFLLLLLAASCGDSDPVGSGDGGGDATADSSTGDDATADSSAGDATVDSSAGDAMMVSVTGAWRGDFTAEVAEGVYWVEIDLVQEGSSFTGTFRTQNLRMGTSMGTIDGTTLRITSTYTDSCTGTSTAVLELSDDGQTLDGTYESNDCFGMYGGTMTLMRQ